MSFCLCLTMNYGNIFYCFISVNYCLIQSLIATFLMPKGPVSLPWRHLRRSSIVCHLKGSFRMSVN